MPAVSLLLFAAAAFAQTHQEQITVQVIEVPVYVERAGNSVGGLTKDDFELFVNGAKQPIEYFDVLDDSTTDATVPVHRRRLFMLLFDLSNSHPFALQLAKTAAGKFISAGAPGDTFAVATIGRSGIRFVVPFTTDGVALQRAVSTLAPTRAGDPFNLATLDTERREWARAAVGEGSIGSANDVFGDSPVVGAVMSGSVTGESPAKNEPNLAGVAQAQQSTEANKQNEDIVKREDDRAFIATLGALADKLAPLAGVKHVLLLSAGSNREQQSDIYDAASEMHTHYRNAGVILSAVDFATDKTAPSTRAKQVEIGPNPMLRVLATDTGGAVSTSLVSIRDMHRTTYVLGFRPQGRQKKENDVKVKVNNVPWGTSIRYRKGYTMEAPAKRSDDLMLADVLLNDIPQSGMTLDVAVAPGQAGASVDASVPGPELLTYATGKPLALDVFVYVFNAKNLPVDWSYSRVNLDLAKGHDFLSSNPYRMNKTFKLQPGHYAAKAVVRVVGTGITGFRRTDFVVQ